MKTKCILLFILLILSIPFAMSAHARRSRRVHTKEQFKEICNLPEYFEVDSVPMKLAFHYSATRWAFITMDYTTEAEDDVVDGIHPGLVMYPQSQKGKVWEYYDLEPYLDDPGVRELILEAAGASTIADLRKVSAYDYWCLRIFWGLIIFFSAWAGQIWLRDYIQRLRLRRKNENVLQNNDDIEFEKIN